MIELDTIERNGNTLLQS